MKQQLIQRQTKRTDLLKKYDDLKKLFFQIDTDETLRKYQVLSKAYKLGKKIYGQLYSVATLSIHFDVPYTTCKRILSLDKANKRTWKLISTNKISAFKVAQVLLSKNTDHQDKIIDIVIKDKLSTYNIKKLRIGHDGKPTNDNRLDLRRLSIATHNGFRRKESAYLGFTNAIHKLEIYLTMDINKLPEKHLNEIRDSLLSLYEKITVYLGELEKHGESLQ